MTAEKREITQDEWVGIMVKVLATHPEWMACTTEAMQHGLMQAVNRQLDRVVKLSWGLHQALSTSRRAKKRNGQMIVDAIQVSTLHPTEWSAAAIAKENSDN